MSYPKAFYTMTMTEFSALWHETDEYSEFVDEMNADFARFNLNVDVAEMYRNAIFNRWHEYEIAGETIYEQSDFLMTTYREYREYHLEQLKLYLDRQDNAPQLEEMLSRTVVSDGSSSGSEAVSETKNLEGTNNRSGANQSIHVDLPNKQIDEDDIYSYPSEGDKGSDTVDTAYTEGQTNSHSNQTTGKTDNTTTYNEPAKYYDMYQKALRSCRNIFVEQADDYYDCFIHIF